jgi:hypothetical protein
VMKPGARLVLCEPWGGNPLLNLARKVRARFAGESEDQGEDIIFSKAEMRLLEPYFSDLRADTMNLLAMGKRLLRARFENAWARGIVHGLEKVDGVLLTIAPPLWNWCGEAVITGRRR